MCTTISRPTLWCSRNSFRQSSLSSVSTRLSLSYRVSVARTTGYISLWTVHSWRHLRNAESHTSRMSSFWTPGCSCSRQYRSLPFPVRFVVLSFQLEGSFNHSSTLIRVSCLICFQLTIRCPNSSFVLLRLDSKILLHPPPQRLTKSETAERSIIFHNKLQKHSSLEKYRSKKLATLTQPAVYRDTFSMSSTDFVRNRSTWAVRKRHEQHPFRSTSATCRSDLNIGCFFHWYCICRRSL
jgi:hypothetical protein